MRIEFVCFWVLSPALLYILVKALSIKGLKNQTGII